MKKLQYIIAWVILLTGSACETEIDYNGKALENFMVLNAKLEADSLISCRITRSNTIFEDRYIQSINDAKVNLYCNGELVGAGNFLGDGYCYWPERKAIQGNEYTIKAEHPNYKSTSANTTIPEKANTWVSDIRHTENGDQEITVTINDKPGANFYRLQIFLAYQEDPDYPADPYYGHEYGYGASNFYTSKDPVLNHNKVIDDDSSFSDYPYNKYGIFNDDLFDGEVYHLKFTANGSSSFEKLIIDIQQISEDLYLYYNSTQFNDYYGDDPVIEPVRIHSNVNGGAGILGSSNSNYIYKEE